jgi:hypothetical protein
MDFSGWGVQIYTDNCAADADPQFYILNPSSYNPAGLVRVADRQKPLKMCWRITDSLIPNTAGDLAIAEKQSGLVISLYNPGLGDGYSCYLWMKDRKTPALTSENSTAFADGEDYVTALDSTRGFQHAEGTWSSGPSTTKYIYLGARFTDAVTPAVYKSGKLAVEFFVD